MIRPRILWLSIIATLAIGLVAFRVTVSTTGGFLVWSDGFAYFFQARSLVIDGNADITNEFNEFDKRYPKDSAKGAMLESIRNFTSRDPNTGQIHSPWPIGMGVVLAPFYALGYGVEAVVAITQGRDVDSYGLIPQYFFAFGSLAFGLLGFWAIYLACGQIGLTESDSYLAAGAAVFAGPAAFYIFVNPTMAHALSFGLTSALLLLWWQQWVRGTAPKVIVVPALILGFLIAIRFQNAIFGILLAALVIREMWRSGMMRSLASGVTGLIACAIPVATLALHAAKFGPAQSKIALQQGGVLLVGNYPLHLKSPYFLDVLFSCRHGAFYWAPILATGLVGLIWAARRESWAPVLLITLFLQTYLIGGLGIADAGGAAVNFDPSNWRDHWKGAPSFGMRYLTECVPIFAMGLAFLMARTQKTTTTFLWPATLAVLVAWNGLLMLAYGLNTISRSQCLTYPDMALGIVKVFGKLAGGLN